MTDSTHLVPLSALMNRLREVAPSIRVRPRQSLALARHYDPAGKFRNAYTARCLGR